MTPAKPSVERAALCTESYRVASLVLLSLLAVFFLYRETLASMVQLWLAIDAYNYCFLIFPISLYLVWQDRSRLLKLPTSRSLRGVILLALFSLCWWLSETVGVQVGSHFFFVMMISAAVLALAGPAITRQIAFPLGYLLFAIPIGELLIPYLIDFTAFFTVGSLRVLGVPVVRNGPFFEVPTGSYEVAKACSGIRFMIVTLAISTLMSHTFFRTVGKRVAFVGLAAALAVVANGIRATTIVLVIHLTDFDISAAPDHAFVGWLTYILLLVFLFAIGWKFGDDEPVNRPQVTAQAGPVGRPVLYSLLAFVAIALGPALSIAAGANQTYSSLAEVGVPAPLPGWRLDTSAHQEWRPEFVGFTDMGIARVTDGDGKIDLAIVRYFGQKQGAEISNTANYAFDPYYWYVVEQRQVSIDSIPLETLVVQEVGASHRDENIARLVWYWTEVNGAPVNGAFETKLAEIKSALTLTETRSIAYFVSAPIGTSEVATRMLMERFLTQYYEVLRRCGNASEALDECDPGTKLTRGK